MNPRRIWQYLKITKTLWKEEDKSKEDDKGKSQEEKELTNRMGLMAPDPPELLPTVHESDSLPSDLLPSETQALEAEPLPTTETLDTPHAADVTFDSPKHDDGMQSDFDPPNEHVEDSVMLGLGSTH